ncbi:metallophosphoesterase [Anaerosolibacter sp.]|uniref:metallophosphoesterase n=1 Tax=Anaerosolibacter sp. TaxID=1872527 RepID=UPI0039EFFDAB
MALYGIGDLHLSGGVHKPMDIFGEQWIQHHEKIKENWQRLITVEDTVLIPGDISWAMNMEQAMVDLEWIHELNGNKILLRGNHDYWWSSVTKLNLLFEDMVFLQNNFYQYKEYAICGTRGWICPNENKFEAQDEKIYQRELQRLKLSLEEARKKGIGKIIVMTHYPPTNDRLEPSGFTQIYEEYGVEKVIYGHLHGSESHGCALQGLVNGIEYRLTACDYIDFSPIKILLE